MGLVKLRTLSVPPVGVIEMRASYVVPGVRFVGYVWTCIPFNGLAVWPWWLNARAEPDTSTPDRYTSTNSVPATELAKLPLTDPSIAADVESGVKFAECTVVLTATESV